MLKISEIRGMSDGDLEGRIASSKQELMKLREKYALRQLKDTSQLRQVRTDIARLLTVRRQRQIERFAQETKA
jgi:large subunit ribosomal protein L29